jgi:hypothetical protein
MSCCNSQPFNFNPTAIAENSVAGLFQELFGDGSKLTYTDGKWVYAEIIGFPKLENEGVIDYLLRILGSGQVLFNKGVWVAGSYCKGSLVAYDYKYYVANLLTSAEPTTNADWSELLYSLEGLQGPAGVDGEGNFTLGQ